MTTEDTNQTTPDPRLNGWREMSNCPRDGTEVLGLFDTNASYEPVVVWWDQKVEAFYPWRSQGEAYAEHRIAYWQPLPPMPLFEDMA
jgi:hypothetical protein